MSTETRERLVALDGAHNLRDFGGYKTKDGRTVAWGKLFRAGAMAKVTDSDVARLRGLGISTICDFRRETERTVAPTLWHEGGGTEYLALNADARTGALGLMVQEGAATRADVHNAMRENYRFIPMDYAGSYKAMFERLAAGQTPVLINCSAGKDRTGIGAALILETLGVAREDIYADYMLTNDYLGYEKLFGKEMKRADGSLVDPEIYAPLALAEVDYLDTFFAYLEGEHGGLEGYLSNTLGIDAEKQDAIRAHLLVS